MSQANQNWFSNPSKRTLWIALITWAIGNLLLLLAFTDFFTHGLQVNTMVSGLMVGSTVTTLKLVLNYIKQNHKDQTAQGGA